MTKEEVVLALMMLEQDSEINISAKYEQVIEHAIILLTEERVCNYRIERNVDGERIAYTECGKSAYPRPSDETFCAYCGAKITVET